MDAVKVSRKTIHWSLGVALVSIIAALCIVLTWWSGYGIVLARGSAGDVSPHGVDLTETVYIPALVAFSLDASATSAPTPRVVPTAFATASPTSRPTEAATALPTPTSAATSTPEATPTATPTTTEGLRFEGSSSQGRTIIVETDANRSVVTKFEMDAQIICPNTSGVVEIRVDDSVGYDIQGDRFQIRVPASDDNDHLISGTLASDGSRMNGSWLIWLDSPESLQPCSDKGEWSAVRQVLQ